MEEDLLELLREKVGCAYISDLHLKEYNEKARMVFEKMDVSGFKTSVVDDAREYLFGINI